jgi:CrcB protein
MERFLWVGFAGALGTWTRYLVNLGAAKMLGVRFPYGTLAVNLTGCFLIAAVMHAASVKTITSDTVRIAIVTGFLGGLTTYSAFNFETTALVKDGQAGAGIANFLITTAGCLLAGLLGLLVARRVFG